MTETELHRLTEDGRRLVGQSFLRGEATLTDEQLSEYVEPMPGHPTGDLDRIDSVVDQVLGEYPEYDTAIDGALAEEIHRGLDITRRTAGDPGLWHWLATVEIADR